MKTKKNQSRSSIHQQSPDDLLSGGVTQSQSHCEYKSVAFNFDAAEAHQVCVAGTFNEWNSSQFKLKKDDQGAWRGSFPVAAGAHQYRFFVDGDWANNPQTDEQIPNAYGGMNLTLNVA